MPQYPKFTHLFWSPSGDFQCGIMINTFWDQLCDERDLPKEIRAKALSGQTDNGSSTFILITPEVWSEIFGELPTPNKSEESFVEIPEEQETNDLAQVAPLTFIASEDQANAMYNAAKLGLELDEYFDDTLRNKAKDELFTQARFHKSAEPDLEPKCDAFQLDSFILEPGVQKKINKSKQWRERKLRSGASLNAILGDSTEGRPIIIKNDWTGPFKKGNRKFKGETKDGEAFDADPEPLDSGPPPAGSLADRLRYESSQPIKYKRAKGKKVTIDDRSITVEKPLKPKKKKAKKKVSKLQAKPDGINSPTGLVDVLGRALPSKRLSKKKRRNR